MERRKGYPLDSTDPKMLDRDWRKLPKVGCEALLERLTTLYMLPALVEPEVDPYASHPCGVHLVSLRAVEHTPPRRSAGKANYFIWWSVESSG